MLIKDIKVNKKKRVKKVRVGRGTGSGLGKTSGKGHKGQKSRSGGTKAPWFEGGQQRITQRIPKVGFKNIFREEYNVINVKFIEEKFEPGAEITREEMIKKGYIKGKTRKVKVLGDGEITKAVNVKAHKFSKTAEEKIKKAGGTAEIIK